MKKERTILLPRILEQDPETKHSSLAAWKDYIFTELDLDRKDILVIADEADCVVPQIRVFCGKKKWQKLKFLMDTSKEVISWKS